MYSGTTDDPIRLIIIDDTHPNIHYQGDWQLVDGKQLDSIGFSGKAHNSSAHVLEGTGSFSFSFQGSFGRVVATNTVRGDLPPLVGCAIDGIPLTGPSSGGNVPGNNWMFCEWEVPNGPHILTFNISEPSQRANNQQPFIFDYILFEPSYFQYMDNETLLIRANDPVFRYDKFWSTFPANSMQSSAEGATMTFSFNGTGVEYLGWLPPIGVEPATATFTVDDRDPVTVGLAPPVSEDGLANHQFFQVRDLAPGLHNFAVRYSGTESTMALILENVIVYNEIGPSRISPPLIPIPTSTSPLSTGAIVGVAFGAFALLVILAFGIWRIFVRRRRLRAQAQAEYEAVKPLDPPPIPRFVGKLRPGDPKNPVAEAPVNILSPSNGNTAPSSTAGLLSPPSSEPLNVGASTPSIPTLGSASSSSRSGRGAPSTPAASHLPLPPSSSANAVLIEHPPLYTPT